MAPPELSRYMAPEVLAGVIAPASDWWSLGVILLERLTGGACFDGVNDQAFLMRVVATGVDIPAEIDPEFEVLLRGLLAKERTDRCQWVEVQAWLKGEPVPVPPSMRDQETEGPGMLVLGDHTYRKPSTYALGAGRQENWANAREQLVGGEIATWLEESPTADRMLSAVRNVVRREGIDDDTRLSVALKILNPNMPLVRSGEIITPSWLLDHPQEGYLLVTGAAPDLLQQIDAEPWLAQLKQREADVRRRAQLHEIELNEDSLRIFVLCTSRMRLEEEWEAQRHIAPDSDHKGLSVIMERRQISPEDLILLLSARRGQFRPLEEIVAEAAELGRREGIDTFTKASAGVLLQLPRREILDQLNGRIEGFSRCGLRRIDEWADQFRLERRIGLARAAVILAVPAEKWQKPPKQEYVAQLLGFFEKRIALSVTRGALARMTIQTTSALIDLMELGSERCQANTLLDHILERTDLNIGLDPAVFTLDLLLERRLRTLVNRADLLRRETGIKGLYMGFPFVLVQSATENIKTRIAPVLLWPVTIVTEVGQRSQIKVGFDREREEVRINPALQSIFAPDEFERWKAATDNLLGGVVTIASAMDEYAMLANRIRERNLAKLPGPDVKVKSGTAEITAAAVLFHVSFAGQAIVEDIRHLRSIPPAGTGLETMLRVQEAASHLPDVAAQHDDDLDRYATAESDPTQDLAVLKARSGPGLVIEGPPGTGKSQTIVNMVADAIGRRRSILIVCQKQAALDVVHKRLQREGLGERLVMIKDLSKDRRPVIEAVRSQVEHILASGASDNNWPRQRKAILERIKRTEDQLNAHQQAMHRRDDLSCLTYRELVGKLISLEAKGELPDVLALRQLFTNMDAERVSATAEITSQLVRSWLPAEYENSPLCVLKSFGWQKAAVVRFLEDLQTFCRAEVRPTLEGAREGFFDVDTHEALHAWSNSARTRLCALSEAECRELGHFSRRYEQKSTLVITNKRFADWGEVFPTAACVASLIDRLVHHAEVFAIDGESYRLKEANERAEQKARQRRGVKS